MIEQEGSVSSPLGTSSEDRDLVLAFQGGDSEAYRAIYDRYSERVYRLCRRMLVSREDADEATQEAFLRVYRALPRFNGRYQLGAWVCRIATNVCLDMLRSRGRSTAASHNVLDLAEIEVEDLDESASPEGCYLRGLESKRVHAALASLSPLHRAAIVLRELEGFSYVEIAQTLDLTEGQVKALLHRARASFRRSWPSALPSLLLPSRWWQRMRGTAAPPRAQALQASNSHSQLGEFVASSAQMASTCTAALQQCGQFMSERVAPLLVAAAVGTAGGAAIAATPEVKTEVVTESSPEDAIADGGEAQVLGRSVLSRKDERPEADPGGSHVEEAPESAPVATPSPEPEPEPTPQPSPSSSPTAPPKETKSVDQDPQAPPPVKLPQVTVAFARGGPASQTPMTRHSLVADCQARTFTQEFASQISDGDTSYPVSVDLSASGNAQLGILLVKDGREYEYRAWGAQPVVTWTIDAGKALIVLEGEYGPVDGSQPSSAGLPISGPFRAELRLDCGTTAVVSESLVLGGS